MIWVFCWKRNKKEKSHKFLIVCLSQLMWKVYRQTARVGLPCTSVQSHQSFCSLHRQNMYKEQDKDPHLWQRPTSLALLSAHICCCWLLNIAINNFSVISRQCLVVTGSSVLTFIVLPLWSIMPRTWHDTTPSHIILTFLALPRKSSEEQLEPFLTNLICQGPKIEHVTSWPPISRSGHSTDCATRTGHIWRITNHTVLWSLFLCHGSYEPHHEKTCLWGFRPGKTCSAIETS